MMFQVGSEGAVLEPSAGRVRLPFRVKDPKVVGLMLLGPGASQDEVGLGPSLRVDGLGRDHRNRQSVHRRVPSSGIHDMPPDFAVFTKELPGSTRSRNCLILEPDGFNCSGRLMRILNADLPS